MASSVYERLQKCLAIVREKTDFVPKTAIVLGSGLGGFAEEIDVKAIVDYKDIDGFPVSTVPGHVGRFIFGYLGSEPIVAMQGRVHFYEGYSMEDVVLPIRLMGLMGAKALFLTNASGGINPDFHAGDFMLIDDHIGLFVQNPLIGQNVDELGTRFPDMSHAYDPELSEIITDTANRLDIPLKNGVYVQLTGPSYESPAEIRMLGNMGVDAVGMSTVVEAIAARHMDMRVCGISCVTNLAAGISKTPLAHADVQKIADAVAPSFRLLVKASIIKICEVL